LYIKYKNKSLKAQQARIKASSKSKAAKDKKNGRKHSSVKSVLPGIPTAAAPEPQGAQNVKMASSLSGSSV